MRAWPTLTSSCAATMPAAWCTTYWKSAPSSSSAASCPGGAWACSTRTAWAATSAMTSASACWSSVDRTGAVAIEVERAEPHRPTWSGNPKTARTPASTAGPLKPSHRGVLGSSQIGLEHGPVVLVRVHAGTLAEVVLQLLDDRAHVVGRADRATWHVTGHEHDPGSGHPCDVGAHIAESLRAQLSGIAVS